MNVAMSRNVTLPEGCGRRAAQGDAYGAPMIGSEPGFSTCLAHALGFEPAQLPTADGDDPDVFWRQWLAGRNLGLVPIDDPVSFAWPGYWIAAVAARTGIATPS